MPFNIAESHTTSERNSSFCFAAKAAASFQGPITQSNAHCERKRIESNGSGKRFEQ
ncbi:hypothetical protein BCR33DRAFT_717616 [Rhizoclosmatium globosum]|uniref:Uncharacterized protein n=1 Tax=Rhizoclosmatium globosum TaxID=329046 RepID=A0A1Y2C8N6_9FUNG|nr:hypothetical protein BCR33DRAFT_717616 [Rhizoclosmatium globosum]|eukprot:ORY43392.1 hypothetical protein BCR33DRAFT_717616 [Rhizoclosmatium globosum]